MAGFHAAQALIFETSGRICKTHSGVNGEFHRLVKDDPRVDDQTRTFLGAGELEQRRSLLGGIGEGPQSTEAV
jgi:uncharacterized protein (UPF0332 family)